MMNTDSWARGALMREPEERDYAGLSYEEASRRAQAICKIAGESGKTMIARRHLDKLCDILTRMRWR